jgi:hypothetical protein
MKSLLVLLITLLASVYCSYFITNPAGHVWNAGETVSIVWQINGENKAENLIIDLMNGPSYNAVVVRNIQSLLPKDSTSTTYLVPNDLPTGPNYFIKITGTGSSPIYAYSGRFQLNSDPNTMDSIYGANTPQNVVQGSSNDPSICQKCAQDAKNSATSIYNSIVLTCSMAVAIILYTL